MFLNTDTRPSSLTSYALCLVDLLQWLCSIGTKEETDSSVHIAFGVVLTGISSKDLCVLLNCAVAINFEDHMNSFSIRSDVLTLLVEKHDGDRAQFVRRLCDMNDCETVHGNGYIAGSNENELLGWTRTCQASIREWAIEVSTNLSSTNNSSSNRSATHNLELRPSASVCAKQQVAQVIVTAGVFRIASYDWVCAQVSDISRKHATGLLDVVSRGLVGRGDDANTWLWTFVTCPMLLRQRLASWSTSALPRIQHTSATQVHKGRTNSKALGEVSRLVHARLISAGSAKDVNSNRQLGNEIQHTNEMEVPSAAVLGMGLALRWTNQLLDLITARVQSWESNEKQIAQLVMKATSLAWSLVILLASGVSNNMAATSDRVILTRDLSRLVNTCGQEWLVTGEPIPEQEQQSSEQPDLLASFSLKLAWGELASTVAVAYALAATSVTNTISVTTVTSISTTSTGTTSVSAVAWPHVLEVASAVLVSSSMPSDLSNLANSPLIDPIIFEQRANASGGGKALAYHLLGLVMRRSTMRFGSLAADVTVDTCNGALARGNASKSYVTSSNISSLRRPVLVPWWAVLWTLHTLSPRPELAAKWLKCLGDSFEGEENKQQPQQQLVTPTTPTMTTPTADSQTSPLSTLSTVTTPTTASTPITPTMNHRQARMAQQRQNEMDKEAKALVDATVHLVKKLSTHNAVAGYALGEAAAKSPRLRCRTLLNQVFYLMGAIAKSYGTLRRALVLQMPWELIWERVRDKSHAHTNYNALLVLNLVVTESVKSVRELDRQSVASFSSAISEWTKYACNESAVQQVADACDKHNLVVSLLGAVFDASEEEISTGTNSKANKRAKEPTFARKIRGMLDEGSVSIALDTVDVICQVSAHVEYADVETRARLYAKTTVALVGAMGSMQWRIIGSRATLADQWAMLLLRHAQGLDSRGKAMLWNSMQKKENGDPLRRLLSLTDAGRRERLEALAFGS